MLTVKEKTTPRIYFSLRGHSGAQISLASLLTLTITLKDPSDNTVINSRDAQDAKNANGVAVAANGDVTWQLDLADTAMRSTTKSQEIRRALFEFTWTETTAQRHHEEIPIIIQGERWLS